MSACLSKQRNALISQRNTSVFTLFTSKQHVIQEGTDLSNKAHSKWVKLPPSRAMLHLNVLVWVVFIWCGQCLCLSFEGVDRHWQWQVLTGTVQHAWSVWQWSSLFISIYESQMCAYFSMDYCSNQCYNLCWCWSTLILHTVSQTGFQVYVNLYSSITLQLSAPL